MTKILPPIASTNASKFTPSSVKSGEVLPSFNAQAYIAIFEDALDQLAVLEDITPETMKTDNQILADKIRKITMEQKVLNERYQELQLEREEAKQMANKTRFKEIQTNLTEISTQSESLNQLLARMLKTHPSVAQNLIKIQQERAYLQTLLSRSIRELKEFRFDSLINTVEEESKKRNTLQNTIDRENESLETLKELQIELNNESRLIQVETKERNQIIQQLKDTIQEINSLTISEQKYVKKEVKAHENSVKLSCSYAESRLKQERDLLQMQLKQETVCHENIMEFLNRQRELLEKSIQDWMQHYEADLESKTQELESLKAKRTQELDKFEELVNTYESLETIVETDRKERAKEAEDKKIKSTRLRAARTIARWYLRILAARKVKVSFVLNEKEGSKPKSGKGKKRPKSGKSAKSKKK